MEIYQQIADLIQKKMNDDAISKKDMAKKLYKTPYKLNLILDCQYEFKFDELHKLVKELGYKLKINIET